MVAVIEPKVKDVEAKIVVNGDINMKEQEKIASNQKLQDKIQSICLWKEHEQYFASICVLNKHLAVSAETFDKLISKSEEQVDEFLNTQK